MKQGLTKRQKEYLDFIRAFIAENEHSPSFEEIGAGMNTSISAAHRIVQELVERGYVVASSGQQRSIAIIPETEE